MTWEMSEGDTPGKMVFHLLERKAVKYVLNGYSNDHVRFSCVISSHPRGVKTATYDGGLCYINQWVFRFLAVEPRPGNVIALRGRDLLLLYQVRGAFVAMEECPEAHRLFMWHQQYRCSEAIDDCSIWLTEINAEYRETREQRWAAQHVE